MLGHMLNFTRNCQNVFQVDTTFKNFEMNVDS